MKSRRLTETDLANMSFLPSEDKRARIESLIRPKRIIGSYEPFRSTVGDALNEQFPFLIEDQQPTPLGKLEEAVIKACKGDDELIKMNLIVAKATHNFATNQNLSAERHQVRRITLAFGHGYDFGMPLIMRDGTSAYAVFPDLRRTAPLSPRGTRFVFSMMNQRLRVNNRDLRELGLQIWRYENNTTRSIRAIPCPDQPLISYEDLAADVRESYDILHEAMKRDEEQRRRRGAEGHGPLFGT